MPTIQLIIPMSGSGKRFKDAGYKDPKPLIQVDGKPIIQHVIELFPGVTDIIFVCNSDDLKNTKMRDILTSIAPSAKIVEIAPHKKGPVYAVSQAFDLIDDNKEVIVSYCDYGTQWDFDKFLSEIRGSDGAIACYKGFHPHMLGSDNYAFCKVQDDILIQIKEKEPFTNDRMSEFASNGTYYFASGALVKKYFAELMDSNINVNGEYYVSLVYNLLVRDDLEVKIFEIDKMLQWGTPYDLEIYKGWSKYFENRNFTIILPMSGRGGRFRQEGHNVPKPFLPINNTPMVARAVQCLPESKHIVFISLREQLGLVRSELHQYFPEARYYFIDEVTEGQACTCEIGIKDANIDLESPILISACDNGVVYNQTRFFELMDDKNNDIIVWSFTNHPTSKINPDMYTWLDVNTEGYIQNVSCKKFIPGLKHAIIGTMYFRKAKYFLDGLNENRRLNIRTNGEFYVDDVLSRNLEQGLILKVFEVDNYICWGTPNDYKTYQYWSEYFGQK